MVRCTLVAAALLVAPLAHASPLDDEPPPAPPRVASVEDAPPANRLGVDGLAAIGLIVEAGGSLRYERALGGGSALLVRGEVAQGVLVRADDDPAGITLFTIDLGYRHYWGGFYVDLELGAVAGRRPGHVEDPSAPTPKLVPPRWWPYVSARAGIGGKLGPIELGIGAMIPTFGVGVHLGFDFASW